MNQQKVYLAQYVVVTEERWFQSPDFDHPVRIERSGRVHSVIFTSSDAEDAFCKASSWIDGFEDANHDGPGDLSLMTAVGIHDIEQICDDPHFLPEKLADVYGLDVGVFDPVQVDEDGIPLVREKDQLSIFGAL